MEDIGLFEMKNKTYETGEVIETYVYRESGHSSIMMWFIGLMVVVVVVFYLLGRMVGKKLKNKKK